MIRRAEGCSSGLTVSEQKSDGKCAEDCEKETEVKLQTHSGCDFGGEESVSAPELPALTVTSVKGDSTAGTNSIDW